MTKHLRLIMLSLLAMICMGGYSAVGDTYKLVTSVSELNAGDVIAIASKESGNALGLTVSSDRCANVAVKIINNAFEYVEGVAELSLEKEGTNWYFATADKKYLSTTAKKKLKYFEKKDSKSATIEFEKTGNALINFPAVDQTNIIRNNGKYGFAFYAPSTGDPVQIYKKQGSGKTATTLSFKDLVGEGVTLINGKLANGNDFNGYTATEKDNVAGTIAYAASGAGVATVDATTGAVIVNPNVYGTTTITATFTPGDTKTYAESTASYKVINKDPNAPVDVVFVASVDKGNTMVPGKDEMSKNGVSIQSENAALGNGENYRFYQNITAGHTFSVKRGFITKIVFEGGTSSYSLKNVKLKDQKNGAITTSSVNKATWEGEAKSVVFTTLGQARATKITVTVKLPVAKDYTLDEEDINVIEDYDNANVTLTRTFYHDNAWNTLCLPFDVDANKVATAFAGAEIREIDPNKCTVNTIQFVPATEIKAGVPYIIKWNENVAEAKPFEETFEGVMLVAEPKPVTINNNDIKFTGFYNKTTADNLGESVAAIGAENKLFKVTSGEMKGFRAAFVLKSNTPASVIKLVIDGIATGIEDLVIDGVKANGRVYNQNGQFVGNSLNGLQPGLYIQNGKKIVVK